MKRNWLLLFGIFAFAFIIVFRCVFIPITHDEASTWLNYRHINVWSCISNPACWGTANNHWLNTLLLQCSAGIFGEDAWSIRLPNVVAGLGYLVFASLLSVRFTTNKWLQVAGFILLCAHTYLLDFFSLARGYGLMSFGVIWSLYALLRYIENYAWRWLLFSLAGISFAIFGNFTALLPYTAMALLWFAWLVFHRKFNLLLSHGVLWLCDTGFLYLLLKFPIKTLAGSGEFAWGSTNIWAMMKDLMLNLLYGRHYFGNSTPVYFLAFVIVLICIIIVFALLTKTTRVRTPVFFIFYLLIMNLIVIIVQQKLTGSLAPIGRKSIYFIPLIFGLGTIGLAFIQTKKNSLLAAGLIALFLLLHLKQTLPLKSCREWYFDAYYPELISTLFPVGPASDSIRLGSSWIFNPALHFYQATKNLPVSGLDYQKSLVIDSSMQYYYVETTDSLGMNAHGFVLEKKIGPFLLFKNNNRKE